MIYLRRQKNYLQFDTITKIRFKIFKNKEIDIPVIDLKKEMYDLETNPLKFYPFGENAHFNIMGYKKASEIICEV